MTGSRLPTVGRRLVTVPLAVALAAVALGIVLLALLTWPVTLLVGRRRRLLRFSAFLMLYLLADLFGVAAAGWVWLRALPLPAPARNQLLQKSSYALLGRLLTLLHSAAERLFGLRIEVTPPTPAADDQSSVPVLVFARHAGPGDSFLLIHALLCDAGLRPQVVLKQFLRWDPCLDVLISRTPHCFVPPGGDSAAAVAEIAALGAAVRPGEAVVIFPEGGNFTELRRTRAIAWLRRTGQLRRAARAQRQRHVLPPRMPGSLALLGGSAGGPADVVFVAHTGLDRLDSLARLWHGVPLREPLTAGWWRVPCSQVPPTRAAQEEWLTDQWSRVDSWIDHEWQQADPRPG
ncbi:1-acyl-sn-glycerol-3-phosphate acyltransferase [Streptacidiphilus carbonis]|uniref:1-acyl-sn-glycerol-3-phosphate acyltransferase n=1 Tax=Streptacidiphilus carbonis TaxID=105422 RepID=UPI0005A7623F|nr:1-acyl-sn-glycerol-3-phosphate acyltransferase [Streptacidiphilus carbonis]